MPQTPLEILLSDEARQLLDSFAALMKIQVVFFAPDGKILKRGRDKDNCDYCKLMQQKFFGPEICLKLDARQRDLGSISGKPHCYTCHAGLNEIISPVILGGQTAGFIVFGQIRTRLNPPEEINSPEAKAAFSALPRLEKEDLKHLQQMIEMLVDFIVSRELIHLPGDPFYYRIHQYIDRHLTEKITLKHLAEHLHCSESKLTHFLRKNFRTNFKELLISRRLECARKLLENHPELNIAEAARQVGYDDPHYFSRLFRNKMGFPPRQLRN